MAQVLLRPTTPSDIEFVVAAEQADENRRFVMPWDRDRHLGSLGAPDFTHRIVADGGTGEAVGFALLAGLGTRHRSVEFRRLVVVPKGRGYGRAAVRAVKALAFGELLAHRLWLDVMEFNAPARRLYESEGFVAEGVLRECWLGEDGFVSLVVMSILDRDYRSAAGDPPKVPAQ